MNGVLLRRMIEANRIRLLVCGIGIGAWGLILPVIYATFGRELGDLIQGNPFLSQFAQFGGGDIFSLSGSIAIGFIHPFSVALLSVFAIGFPLATICGERQRGTLEVLLARPISRRSLYITSFVAGALFLAVLLAVELAMNVLSASLVGVVGEMDVGKVPLVWLNGWLLFVAFMAIALAASVSFDRLAPALGATLTVILAMYVVDVIAGFWPDAAWIADYSLFHYVKAKTILDGALAVGDLALLGLVAAAAVAVALVVFPRRDIAAPS